MWGRRNINNSPTIWSSIDREVEVVQAKLDTATVTTVCMRQWSYYYTCTVVTMLELRMLATSPHRTSHIAHRHNNVTSMYRTYRNEKKKGVFAHDYYRYLMGRVVTLPTPVKVQSDKKTHQAI